MAKDRSYDLAIEWLLKSVLVYPWNWGAWLELSCLIRDGEQVRVQFSQFGSVIITNDGMKLNQVQSKLQPHVMAFIFSVHCRQELYQSSTAQIGRAHV